MKTSRCSPTRSAWAVWPLLVVSLGCSKTDPTDAGANGAALTTADLPQASADVFKLMDGGIQLTEDEVKGRNTWILWTAGNEQFWDRLARESFGLVDLLKTLDTRKRGTRFKDMGLVNEPGFRTATKPDEYGLWLDTSADPPPAGIDPRVYGKSSGVLGLRIYSNPAFDDEAKKRWDPQKYYEDRDYYGSPTLVRPYRVGMSCGFCHIAPHPLRPPADPEAPRWENLASAIGNQYFREGRAFAFGLEEDGFFKQMLEAQPPGTSDTSRVATDHNNNPNAMNAIFDLGARLKVAKREKIAGGALNLPGGEERDVPHILKDGADSIGVAGATIRVFVNIGLFHQEWLECHNALIGLKPQRPFEIAKAQRNSVYWRATEERLANVVKFFMKIQPMHLEDAPGGKDFLTKDEEVLQRGKVAFAENCAKCHSSKRPPEGVDPGSNAGDEWFRQSVSSSDFRGGNFLSDEVRHSVAKIKTNACRAVGTNARRDHVWDNFSSGTYKELPSVGDIEVYNPMDPSKPLKFAIPGGGPGYYRTPSLISIWSSAPFLHNNSLGVYTGDPSVAGRMKAFNDAAEKLLWPEKRLGPASIWRTTKDSYVKIPKAVLPTILHGLCENGFLSIGPIPSGTPINLLANIDPDSSLIDLAKLCLQLKEVFLEAKVRKLSPTESADLMKQKLVPRLLEVSKCPDLVEDHGHEFGTSLPDADKKALIEFLKTL